MFVLDLGGHVLTWNRGAQRIKGYAAEQIIGQHFSIFYPAEDLAAQKPQRELEIALAQGHVEDEGWRLRRDGGRFWAFVSITLLRDDSGQPRGFAKVTRDLTERREAQEELRLSEERFRRLVDGVSDYAIYMLDPSGVVTTWNSGAQKIKGYKASEIIGRNFSLFFTPEDREAGRPQLELGIAAREGRYEEEGWRLRADGSTFWANVILTPLHDPAGNLLGFSKVTRDLTARRIAEETARAAQKAEATAREMQLAGRLKDEFLATVSHELRTPLNAILGWSSVLLTRSDQQLVEKGVEVIHRNAKAQSKIIEDILDVSRIITGQLRIEMKPVDLIVIIGDAIEAVRPSAVARDIQLEIQGSSEPWRLIGDAERLQQVMWNLLSNAVKFNVAGGRIRIKLERGGGQLSVSIADDGKGIEPEFLPYVFDRFKQADGSTTRRHGGLGLGLAIVRHIVELHGGHVQAASPGPGQGSTFTIWLPVRATIAPSEPPPSTAARPEASSAPTAPPELAGVHVLVVDDERDARELLELVLTRSGARVSTAGSVSSALTLLESATPDVIVSDVGMPEEDGYSFMRRVRQLAGPAATIPAIALTAYTRRDDERQALAMGFSMHLGKPVDPDELTALVRLLAPNAGKKPGEAP